MITKELLIELFEIEKLTKTKICSKLGISYNVLERYIREFSINPYVHKKCNSNRGKSLSTERKQKISLSLIQKPIPSLEKLQECDALYKQGNSITKICSLYSTYHQESIINYIRNNNIPIDTYQASKETLSKELLEDMYIKQFLSINEIHKETGVPYQHVNKMIKEYGIPKRSHSSTQTISMKKFYNTVIESGNKHLFQTEEFKESTKQTKIKLYGTPYPNLSMSSSKAENEIREYLKELTGEEFKKYYIDRTEYDMYSKRYNLAIEYCGLYWHSDNNHANPKDKKYHIDKLKLAESNGIRLITIFEDEWKNRKTQVCGFLKSIVCKQQTMRASKCSLQEISKSQANQFYENYHIQGKTNNNIIFSYGLFYNNILCGAMSISKHHRKNDNSQVVLSRMCFLPSYRIHGGASRLFKKCLEKINCEIISWSDNRWSQGNVYKQLGFELKNELLPDYSYVKGATRIPKQSMQKSNFPNHQFMTENEIAELLGYSKIWDCGKILWSFDKK